MVLKRKAAELHAEAVLARVQKLSCPVQQKKQLLEGVMEIRKRAEHGEKIKTETVS